MTALQVYWYELAPSLSLTLALALALTLTPSFTLQRRFDPNFARIMMRAAGLLV